MKNDGLRKWLIHKLGGVMMAEAAFSNPPYVVKQYEKVPVKLRAHSFVDDKTPDGVRDWIIRRLVEKIAEGIYEKHFYTLRELDSAPHSVDGHEIEMTVEILPPVDGW